MAADLGFSTLAYGVDKFHDTTYDFVADTPRKIRHAPQEIRKVPGRVKNVPGIVRNKLPGRSRHRHRGDYGSEHRDQRQDQDEDRAQYQNQPKEDEPERTEENQVMSRRTRGYDGDGEDDGYESDDAGPRDDVAKSRYENEPGPAEQPYQKSQKGGRSGYGVDDEVYESSRDPRVLTAKDGYQRDARSDAYEERRYGSRSELDRGQGYSRGYQPVVPYNRRRRSSADMRDDREVYYERRHEEKRSRSRPRKELEEKKHKAHGFLREGHDDGAGNDATKKWAATIAGAAAGGLAGRQAKKEHWVPAAMGALIGGFVAREGEKEFYRRKERQDLEKHKMRSSSR
ncbi:hypothetical protein EJ08DRAFT_693735 [Tothia fuscella]|uniref:Glycine zipper 2TM domain-containing protein n=1 Tax=Tothia fuscella TaxID=1048955 RepID=A0A9P4NZH1_9PEZI|nr:hypothetical protein EJ08DRAFT_693735 [Tothia fuscella]